MKKIIFYIGSMQIGGANRVMSNLIEHYGNRGYNIVLINDICQCDGIQEYSINPNVKRIYLKGQKHAALLKNLIRLFDLRKTIKQEHADAIISFMGPPNIRMLIATCGLKIKKFASVRNDPKFEYGLGIKKHFASVVFRLADGVVFQTIEAADYFPLSVRDKSKVIFNPVASKFFECDHRVGGNDIVVIGRLQPQKNPFNVLKAFELSKSKLRNFNLLFCGDGEMMHELKEYVCEHLLGDNVKFLGVRRDIEAILETAALYVLCSDFEGMPNALMEAMAVGVPVISTDCPCGGPRALIQNNNQGILVPCRDEVALSNAMVEILSDKKKQKIMGECAARRARSFETSKILEEWDKFLNV